MQIGQTQTFGAVRLVSVFVALATGRRPIKFLPVDSKTRFHHLHYPVGRNVKITVHGNQCLLFKSLLIENRFDPAAFGQSESEIDFEEFVAGDAQMTVTRASVILLHSELET